MNINYKNIIEVIVNLQIILNIRPNKKINNYDFRLTLESRKNENYHRCYKLNYKKVWKRRTYERTGYKKVIISISPLT